jgi:hypothetical protein
LHLFLPKASSYRQDLSGYLIGLRSVVAWESCIRRGVLKQPISLLFARNQGHWAFAVGCTNASRLIQALRELVLLNGKLSVNKPFLQVSGQWRAHQADCRREFQRGTAPNPPTKWENWENSCEKSYQLREHM